MTSYSRLVTAVGLVIFIACFGAGILPDTERSFAQSADKILLDKREEAYRANNLGVAELEQFNYNEAVTLFRRALSIDPQLKLARINLAIALFNANDAAASQEADAAARIAPGSPQAQYILGLIAKNQNRLDDAIAAFKKVLAVDPNDVGANVNLGQLYMQQRKYDDAITLFRTASNAEPYNSTALYNLATSLLRRGSRDEGQQMMSRFQTVRQTGAATSIGQSYLEQGRYAEAIVSTGAESELVDETLPRVRFQNATGVLPVQKPGALTRPGSVAVGNSDRRAEILHRFTTGATLFDFDGDGDLDLAKVDNGAGRGGGATTHLTGSIALYRNDGGKYFDITRGSGDIAKPFNAGSTGIVAGDFDNDGSADLFVIGYRDIDLFRNVGHGRFVNVSVQARLPRYPYLSVSTAFVDVDHDGDLDIFIAGFADLIRTGAEWKSMPPAPNMLLRNNGDGTFLDISESAKINPTKRGNAVAVVPTDFDNRRDVDLLVLNYDSVPNLLRNLRDRSFRDVAGEVGLAQSGKWTCAAVGDFNKDSFVDFFFGRADGRGVFASSDGRGKFVMSDAPRGTEQATSAQFIDYDNDGLLDLVVNTETGFAVARNLGRAWSDANASVFKVDTDRNNDLKGSRQMLAGDMDNDGDEDLFAFARNGTLHSITNSGGNTNESQTVGLQGRNSNRTGIGAKIDMRAGSLIQRLETYSATPAPAPSDVQFGLGMRRRPDAVRVVWPSGVVQAETSFGELPGRKSARLLPLKIQELDRKPSSCPYLYTWNGERFEFITDFLGGGEMGNWASEGSYHYPDSNEYVRIPPGKLRSKNGRYEIRITNELEEVLFVDHLRLTAIEHDADAAVYPNEGLGIPASPEHVLYTTFAERSPISAVDRNGRNVLPEITGLDRNFYDSFEPLKIRGYAREHSLTLNLDNKKGYEGRTLLLLTGWTDYAFSSDNLAASQSGRSLFMPRLQVRDGRGRWQTVISSIGIPVGRPQTIVVDLTGKFLTPSREVRIVTNFKTYWDKIAVDTSAGSDVKVTDLRPSGALLAERGFSKELKFGEMITANYEEIVIDGRWKYFSGSFTRLGDVLPLIEKVDDVFVIAKTGDELILSFPALPHPPNGRKYTFLLFADGYSKEMDINSGSPDAVLPLPFKRMKKYPYGADEHFPMTDEKRKVYDEYTTRVVRGFLPRIEASVVDKH